MVDTVRTEEPDLCDDRLRKQVTDMLREAVEAELCSSRAACAMTASRA
ncbi:hypothetical protein GCM10020295_26890 [Streptomyces cinereospinus]